MTNINSLSTEQLIEFLRREHGIDSRNLANAISHFSVNGEDFGECGFVDDFIGVVGTKHQLDASDIDQLHRAHEAVFGSASFSSQQQQQQQQIQPPPPPPPDVSAMDTNQLVTFLRDVHGVDSAGISACFTRFEISGADFLASAAFVDENLLPAVCRKHSVTPEEVQQLREVHAAILNPVPPPSEQQQQHQQNAVVEDQQQYQDQQYQQTNQEERSGSSSKKQQSSRPRQKDSKNTNNNNDDDNNDDGDPYIYHFCITNASVFGEQNFRHALVQRAFGGRAGKLYQLEWEYYMPDDDAHSDKVGALANVDVIGREARDAVLALDGRHVTDDAYLVTVLEGSWASRRGGRSPRRSLPRDAPCLRCRGQRHVAEECREEEYHAKEQALCREAVRRSVRNGKRGTELVLANVHAAVSGKSPQQWQEQLAQQLGCSAGDDVFARVVARRSFMFVDFAPEAASVARKLWRMADKDGGFDLWDDGNKCLIQHADVKVHDDDRRAVRERERRRHARDDGGGRRRRGGGDGDDVDGYDRSQHDRRRRQLSDGDDDDEGDRRRDQGNRRARGRDGKRGDNNDDRRRDNAAADRNGGEHRRNQQQQQALPPPPPPVPPTASYLHPAHQLLQQQQQQQQYPGVAHTPHGAVIPPPPPMPPQYAHLFAPRHQAPGYQYAVPPPPIGEQQHHHQHHHHQHHHHQHIVGHYSQLNSRVSAALGAQQHQQQHSAAPPPQQQQYAAAPQQQQQQYAAAPQQQQQQQQQQYYGGVPTYDGAAGISSGGGGGNASIPQYNGGGGGPGAASSSDRLPMYDGGSSSSSSIVVAPRPPPSHVIPQYGQQQQQQPYQQSTTASSRPPPPVDGFGQMPTSIDSMWKEQPHDFDSRRPL